MTDESHKATTTDPMQSLTISDERLPKWVYQAPSSSTSSGRSPPDPTTAPDLGTYTRRKVTNLTRSAQVYADLGLRLLLAYQHELAADCFLAAAARAPHCAWAHGMVAVCHAPNYNFKGEPYYESTFRAEEADGDDLHCGFPSQHVAERHSRRAMELVETLQGMEEGPHSHDDHDHEDGTEPRKDTDTDTAQDSFTAGPHRIPEGEAGWLQAIRCLTHRPGLSAAEATVQLGRPYAEAMRQLFQADPDDPDITYWYVDALMVLNAWALYDYPSGAPLSEDVQEIRTLLERALTQTDLEKVHPGLLHLYVHLMEMSPLPELALDAGRALRKVMPEAGHLVHMGTHIDVLVGDYGSCVRENQAAIRADRRMMEYSPKTAGPESFYFNYIVHNYHMLVYGAILGGMEGQGIMAARELCETVKESLFEEHRELATYLESYSALDVHVMVRFGRWKEILELPLPKNEELMIYRAGSLRVARGLALAVSGRLDEAQREAQRLDELRLLPETKMRVLYNNSVDRLLDVEAAMLHGEIAYRQGNYDQAFSLLSRAVELQDQLNYDEPWGKMQPVRHALGGLMLEQGRAAEAADVFRSDLKLHPKNPFALVGLIGCLKQSRQCCKEEAITHHLLELQELEAQLSEQRSHPWADFDIVVACECCQRRDDKMRSMIEII